MTQQPKPRKRIIPEQIISPTKAHNGNLAATASPQVEIGDLKVHSTVAAEQLGPGRKIYVDLAEYQKNAKAVDWREVSSALELFDQKIITDNDKISPFPPPPFSLSCHTASKRKRCKTGATAGEIACRRRFACHWSWWRPRTHHRHKSSCSSSSAARESSWHGGLTD